MKAEEQRHQEEDPDFLSPDAVRNAEKALKPWEESLYRTLLPSYKATSSERAEALRTLNLWTETPPAR